MNTEEKILSSALDVFVDHGFSASTSMITKNAQVSTGILFHYFSTKDNLIIHLYSVLIRDYFNHMINWADNNILEDDLEGYCKNLKIGWNRAIAWGLQNWREFQYIQLFESSMIADQFSMNEDQDFEIVYSSFAAMTELGVKYGYLKDLPTPYLIEISRSLINSTTEFLHNHPIDSSDIQIKEKLWLVYWDMVMR